MKPTRVLSLRQIERRHRVHEDRARLLRSMKHFTPDFSRLQLEHLTEKGDLMFEILKYLGRDDPEYYEGVEGMRLQYLHTMSGYERGSRMLVMDWSRIINWFMAFSLPEPELRELQAERPSIFEHPFTIPITPRPPFRTVADLMEPT